MTNATPFPKAPTCQWPDCASSVTSDADLPDGEPWLFCGAHTERFIQRWRIAQTAIDDAAPPIDDGTAIRIAKPHPAPPAPAIRRPSEGHLYYLLIGDVIKVGFTSNLPRRMRQYPPHSELLAVAPGTRSDEREFHQVHMHVQAHGREWYRDCEELRAEIAEVVAKHGPPTATNGRKGQKRHDIPNPVRMSHRSSRRTWLRDPT